MTDPTRTDSPHLVTHMEYLGRVAQAAQALMLLDGGMTDRDDAIDVAFGLVDAPVYCEDRAPSVRERRLVSILLQPTPATDHS